MISAAQAFRQRLGKELGPLLGPRFRFLKSRLELRAETEDVREVVILSGGSKFSPHVNLEFYIGCNYSVVRAIEPKLGPHRYPYHVQQYSRSFSRMHGLAYQGPGSWSVDITTPPKDLVLQVAAAFDAVAIPFFERFATVRSARDAIASDDSWCFGGSILWRQLLLLDAALGDLDHFERWAVALNSFDANQASGALARLRDHGN